MVELFDVFLLGVFVGVFFDFLLDLLLDILTNTSKFPKYSLKAFRALGGYIDLDKNPPQPYISSYRVRLNKISFLIEVYKAKKEKQFNQRLQIAKTIQSKSTSRVEKSFDKCICKNCKYIMRDPIFNTTWCGYLGDERGFHIWVKETSRCLIHEALPDEFISCIAYNAFNMED